MDEKKEQPAAPVEMKAVPPEIEGGAWDWFFVCGECHGLIDTKDDECPHCKRKIDWDKV